MQKFNFIQIGCKELDAIDSRQANAIIKHKPDIVIFEYPSQGKKPETIFNKYLPSKKPIKEINKIINNLKTVGKKYPWVMSDIQVFKNIVNLWQEGRQVYLYNVDGPSDLNKIGLDYWKSPRPCPKNDKYITWWVKMYLREVIMTQNIRLVLNKNYKETTISVLVFLEIFHYRHVKFLLKKPSSDDIWKYYFGNWSKLSPEDISEILKKDEPKLYKYWSHKNNPMFLNKQK